MIMKLTRPGLDEKELSEYSDANGEKLFASVQIARRRGQGFLEYEWPKFGFDDPQPKMSFVMAFAPWGWVIGNGAYVDDLGARAWATARSNLAIGRAPRGPEHRAAREREVFKSSRPAIPHSGPRGRGCSRWKD